MTPAVRGFSFFIIFLLLVSACKKQDATSPLIILNEDPVSQHYLNFPYSDPGFVVIDNYSCELSEVYTESDLDTSKYGTYHIMYTTEDEMGNFSTETRAVDILLRKEDFYDVDFSATDTCSSGTYFYSGLIQDCDCVGNYITVANISNFGLSAIFTLPLSGTYNEIITIDTIKSAVHFQGSGKMSPAADTIYWQYSISDSIGSDICSSVWVKN